MVLPSHHLRGRQPTWRLKTAGYRDAICKLATRHSYRSACTDFNESHFRTDTQDEVPLMTFADDVEEEGLLFLKAKHQKVREIWEQYGFDYDTGAYGDTFPQELKCQIIDTIEFVPKTLLEELVPGFDPDAPEFELPDSPGDEALPGKPINRIPASTLEELFGSGEAYSKPDLEEREVKKQKRTGKRVVDPEDREKDGLNWMNWYNQIQTSGQSRVLHRWVLEKDTSNMLYIVIDVVYVDRQKEVRKAETDEAAETGESRSEKGHQQNGNGAEGTSSGHEDENEPKKIAHVNIRLETQDMRYMVTDLDLHKALKEMVAVILINELYKKHMVVFMDGEVRLCTELEKYLSPWQYEIYLDWAHLQHKIYDRLSNAIVASRVPDPRGKKVLYRTKKKEGQVKSQEMTSLSRLYARMLERILWVGNVDIARYYLKHINPKDIKNQKEIDQLDTYLKNKASWICCYALRKRAGLRNSSNGVEGQNETLVANRQKHNRTAWCTAGSSILAALTALYKNNGATEWFLHRSVALDMVPFKASSNKDSTVS